VLDANILIAALLRDSTTRRLVVVGGHELHAPDYLFDEIDAHRDELSKRSGQPPNVFGKPCESFGRTLSNTKRRTTTIGSRKPKASSEVEIRRTFRMWLLPSRSKRMGSGRRIEGSSLWKASLYTGPRT